MAEITLKMKGCALDFDMFAGDFGDGTDRCLYDKIVKVRKEHRCHICDGETKVGELARSAKWIFDGELMSYYCCQECVIAMAKSEADDDDEEDCGALIESRYAIGDASRNERRMQERAT